MPGITFNSNVGQLEGLRSTFRKYAAWNHRDGVQLFVDQCRKFATELYAQTAAIAPTKAEIAADVRKLGWKIPRNFPDGRMGRGFPSQWMGAAYARQKKKQGRGAGQANQKLRDAFMGQKATLAQMQAFVIKQRSNARLYLASGWLGAVADLGGSLKTSSGAVDRSRGGATIRRGPSRIDVEFWNRTPGIETMDAKANFVEKAIAVRTVDMWAYIRRKRAEKLTSKAA